VISISRREQAAQCGLRKAVQEKAGSVRGESSDLIAVQASIMASEYVRYYFAKDVERFTTTEVEIENVSPLVNPATGRSSPSWKHASKLDALAFDRFNNEAVIVEHKSTSERLDLASPYWRKLAIDSQVSKYLLSLRQSGYTDIRTVVYDVVSKPTTKPKQVVKADVRKIAEKGSYYGFPLPSQELQSIREVYESSKGKSGGFTGKLRESWTLYGFRLRRLIMEDYPSWFRRQWVTRSNDELEEYATELWQLAGELRKARNGGIAPKNSANCSAFGRLCEYFPLCIGEQDEGSDRYQLADFVHAELNSLASRDATDNGGRNLLTNSRLVMFQSCRQKEFLKYETGLIPAEGTDSFALQWGTLFHELMETIWLSYDRTKGVD